METINDNNYELWLVRYADGDVTGAEREAVEAWLASHPDAAEELSLFCEAPRLQRDTEVHYTGPLAQRTRPLWAVPLRWAAAAAVVAAIMWPVLQNEEPETQQIAEVTEPKCDDEAVAPVLEEVLAEAAPTRQRTPEPEPLVAVAEEATQYTEEPSDTVAIETIEVPQVEQASSVIFVENLIVYEEGPEPSAELVTINEVIYTNTGSSSRPVEHFISTFIKTIK